MVDNRATDLFRPAEVHSIDELRSARRTDPISRIAEDAQDQRIGIEPPICV
jgi:hypothetical protein